MYNDDMSSILKKGEEIIKENEYLRTELQKKCQELLSISDNNRNFNDI